ncbi:MAG TPA: hypothetical protein VFX05_11620 [Casimicrobiaceae bacterium]|nr:hypothetical protein [Casimicrobiaceae bacterium]
MDPLRIAVVVDARPLFAWEASMLRRIGASGTARIVIVVAREDTPPRAAVPPAAGLAASILARLEDKVGGCEPDALAVGDAALAAGVPQIALGPVPGPRDVERLRALALDVIVDLGATRLGGLSTLARHGAWSIVQSGARSGSPDARHEWGAREVADRTPVTEVRIVRESASGRNAIARTRFATAVLSTRQNRNDAFWKASLLLPRALARLQRAGPQALLALEDADGATHSDTLPSAPRLALRMLGRIYGRRVRGCFVAGQWILLEGTLDALPPALAAFRPRVPPPDRLWADPHVVVRDGRHHVFIEEMRYAEGRGRIAVLEERDDGTWSAPRAVLEEPWHLSNPVVFAHDGRWYMIPESAAHRSVDLYRCVAFPDRWERCATLLADVYAVDATVHFRAGKWWLFATIREHVRGPADDDLFLFWSEDLERGPWHPHPLNPLVSDATRARAAGDLFEHGGKLYRPAQDCSVRYGYGIRLHEVLALSTTAYEEREVAFIAPAWDRRIVATHTLSAAGRVCFADALRERWALFPPARQRG